MTVSTDERHEVAERLREANEHGFYNDKTFVDELEIIIGTNPCGDYAHLMTLYRLADLIEPEERTCGEWRGGEYITNGGFTETYAELWCEHCDIPLEEYWQYCPECGAKVVSE